MKKVDTHLLTLDTRDQSQLVTQNIGDIKMYRTGKESLNRSNWTGGYKEERERVRFLTLTVCVRAVDHDLDRQLVLGHCMIRASVKQNVHL